MSRFEEKEGLFKRHALFLTNVLMHLNIYKGGSKRCRNPDALYWSLNLNIAFILNAASHAPPCWNLVVYKVAKNIVLLSMD